MMIMIRMKIFTRSIAESEAYSLSAAVSRGKLTTEHWRQSFSFVKEDPEAQTIPPPHIHSHLTHTLKQTDRQTDRQTDKKADTHKYT